MRRGALALAVALGLMFVGCGGGEDASPVTPTASPTSEPTPPPTSDDSTVSKRLACQAEWNRYVDEWNELVEQRDAEGAEHVVDDGAEYEAYGEWAAANGYPGTFEGHCGQYQ